MRLLFFIDYKNRLIFLSCDILRISLIYAFSTSKKREFEIKSKNSKLSVIDKLYVNGGLLFKKAVCRDSRQGVGYKVTE